MEFWLDTINTESIQKAVRLGILAGVTTNPSLIAKSSKNIEQVLDDLLHYQEGFLAAQVVAEGVEEMVQQGQNLFEFSNRIIVKVPITKEGLQAIHQLSRQGIPTMATALFSAQQALMAALAGADYIAPYLSRLEDLGTILSSITRIFQNYQLKTKILGASINHTEQAIKCAEFGIYGITVKEEIFDQLVGDNPHTHQTVLKFAEDWKSIQHSFLSR